MKVKHYDVKKIKRINCVHENCDSSFKSYKLKKIIHHDIYDEECKNEKLMLQNLIILMKDCLNNLIQKTNIQQNKPNAEEIEELESYNSLKNCYNSFFEKNLNNDIEYYISIFGKNFKHL